jgi:polar amino acid transport system substrate-binding protein
MIQMLGGVGVAAMLPRVAYAADGLETIKDRKKIIVAIDLGNPPHGMMDDKFQPTGSDVETAQLLAHDLGVELEIVKVPSPTRIQMLLANKVDIVISGLSITDERKKVVSFSVPYAQLFCVVAAPAAMPIKSYADLAGKSVAVTRGTVNDQWLSKGIEGVSNVKVMRFEDESTSSTAVTSGQLQVYAAAVPLIVELKKTHPQVDLEVKFEMQGFPIAIAFRQNEPALKTYLDDWVTNNLRNGKLVNIYRKWQNVDLVPEDLIRLKS